MIDSVLQIKILFGGVQNEIFFLLLHTFQNEQYMENVFAQRLVNARKMKGLSQRDLSNAVSGQISPTAIAKYEKGLMMPSSATLLQLAKALGMKIDYFFRPFTVPIDINKFEFRKHSGLKGKKEEAVKHLICSEIEKYIEIETILGMNEVFSIDYKDRLVQNEQDVQELAIRFRQDMKLGMDGINSAVELLESIGVKIIEIDYERQFSGTCNTAGTVPVIIINKNMTPERKRLTIFHELGHLLLAFAEDADVEKLCTVFANEVLIPSEVFKTMIGESRHDISLVELQAIQKDFGISVDALMAKAAALNVISGKRYTTYHKKKNIFPKLKEEIEKSLYHKEHITNRFERLVYSALAREMVSYSKAAVLLDTSVADVRERINLM